MRLKRWHAMAGDDRRAYGRIHRSMALALSVDRLGVWQATGDLFEPANWSPGLSTQEVALYEAQRFF